MTSDAPSVVKPKMNTTLADGARRPQLRVLPGTGGGKAKPTEAELIQAVVEGDVRLAGELYAQLVGTVDRTLYRVFGRREQDHDDLVQMAFEQIVLTLSRQTFAGGCSLKTWAAAITSRVGWKVLRSRRRERQVLDVRAELSEDTAAGSTDVEREAGCRLELERVRIHLSQMKSKQAEAVFLHDVLGHELVEIAHMTEATVAAAQSRLVRGRRELTKRVLKFGPEPKEGTR